MKDTEVKEKIEYKKEYKNLVIFLNNYGEFCVCRPANGGMVCYNAGFDNLGDAKGFIDEIKPTMSKEELEKIARSYQQE